MTLRSGTCQRRPFVLRVGIADARTAPEKSHTQPKTQNVQRFKINGTEKRSTIRYNVKAATDDAPCAWPRFDSPGIAQKLPTVCVATHIGTHQRRLSALRVGAAAASYTTSTI